MKVKLLALTALLFAGICHAQTVTFTSGAQIFNQTFINTAPNKPAIIIATSQPVLFQGCTIESPGDGIDQGFDSHGNAITGTQVSVINCTCLNTSQSNFGGSGYLPGNFLWLVSPAHLFVSGNTISSWASPALIQGLTPPTTPGQIGPIWGFEYNNFNGNAGPITCQGIDQAPLNVLTFQSNAFSGVINPSNLIYVVNNGSAVACQVFSLGNTVSAPFTGFMAEFQGSFISAGFSAPGGGPVGQRQYYVGTEYWPPSAAGLN